MHFATTESTINLFADDTNVFISAKKLSDVFIKSNIICSQLSCWFRSNLLSVNYDKTCFMLFKATKTDEITVTNENFKIAMDNNVIKRSNCINFLGMHIDDNLTFKNHINFLLTKINSMRGMFYHRREFISEMCCKMLYFALVHSRLLYGIELYSTACKTSIYPLQISNNRVLRTLQNVNRYYSIKKLHENYNLLPIDLLGNLCICKRVYSSINNHKDANPAYDCFKATAPKHSYSTRLSNTNYLYKQANGGFFGSYLNKCCSLWNALPIHIRDSTSTYLFNMNLKKYYFLNWKTE